MLSSVQTTEIHQSVITHCFVISNVITNTYQLNGSYTPPLSAPKGCRDFPFCHIQRPDANSRSSQEGHITCLHVVLDPLVLCHLALLPQSQSVQLYT